MRVLSRYLIVASVLVAAGIGSRTAGRLQERAAAAQVRLLTMNFDAPTGEYDAIERELQYLRQAPGLASMDAGIRAQRATSRYWQGRYADLAPTTTAGGQIAERDPSLLLLAANAAYRSTTHEANDPTAVPRLEGLLTQYADALRRAPWRFDTAYNYEFVARRRDGLVRTRAGKAPAAATRGGAAAPPPAIHGHAGTVPPGVDMSEFKIVVPQRSDERREQPEAGKGGPKPRRG